MASGLRLLERENELARTSQLVDGAVAGEFGAVVVEGPAGAGKSAMLGALAARAVGSGMRVLRAVGLELERDYPFGVVRQLFEPAVQGLEQAVRSEVFAGAAAMARPLIIGERSDSGPQLADPGFALIHSLYWVLVGLTDLAPVALVVDDVQWADRQSLRFIGFALRRAEQLPLLVALGHRDPAAEDEPEELAAVLSGSPSVLQLRPLSAAATGLLLAGALGRGLDERLLAEAMRLTAGNPLYVRELADALSAAGFATVEDPLAILRAAAPAAVGRRVQVALGRLDRAAADLARAAAILGDEVPLRLAAALGEIDDQDAGAAADGLAGAGILAAGEPLRFRHPLVREAVLESIEPRARARAHARAGRLLIAEGEPAEHAALHLLDSDPAGDPQVVSTLRAAAERATAQAAPELAISILRRALREPPQRAQRPLVMKELALAETRLGDKEAVGHFEEAFAMADSLEQMADSAVAYGFSLLIAGRPGEEAEAVIDRVLEAISDRERRLRLEAELFGWGYAAYELPHASERLARVTAGLTGQSPAERLLLGLRAADAVTRGAISAAAAAPPIAWALGERQLLAELGPESPAYLRLVIALMQMDEFDLLDRELDRAASEATRRGASFGLAFAAAMRGLSAWDRGRLLSAEPEARTGVEIAAQMGWLAGVPFALTVLVGVLDDTGDFGDADRLLHENNWNGQLPPGLQFTDLLASRGRLRLTQGRFEEGIEDLEEVRARLEAGVSPPPVRVHLAKVLVPALVQSGRREDAREIADEALRAANAFGTPLDIAHGLRARALAAEGGPNLDALREAAAIYERLDSPVDFALTLVEIGSALRRRRQPAAAREPLRRALDLARASGARPLAERAEHELRAAGARPRRDRITGRDALTATERRVAQLAHDGMTNRQIAETLFVTRKTVESHLEHVFRKLGIHARGELERALTAEDEPSPVG